MGMNRFLAMVAALVASVLVLAGCGAPAGAPGPMPMPGAPVRDNPMPGAPVRDAAGGAAPAAPMSPEERGGERQVIRTASVVIVVADPVAGATQVREVGSRFDAWVTSEEIRSDEAYGYGASLVMSVPATRLDEFLDALGAIGRQAHRSQTAADVTERLVDVDARIRTLEASIARVQELMDRTGSVADIATVERELTDRQSDLESMRAIQKNLQGQVERAQVSVSLTTRPVGENAFADGLAAAWRALQDSILALFWLVGALIPFVVAIGAVWLVVRAILRRRPRKPKQPRPGRGGGTPVPQPVPSPQAEAGPAPQPPAGPAPTDAGQAPGTTENP